MVKRRYYGQRDLHTLQRQGGEEWDRGVGNSVCACELARCREASQGLPSTNSMSIRLRYAAQHTCALWLVGFCPPMCLLVTMCK